MKIPPKETAKERINAVLTFLFNSNTYFFWSKKLIIIPTSEEMMLINSTGIDVIFDKRANNPMSTKVATPEDAANLVFSRNNFFITSFFINVL